MNAWVLRGLGLAVVHVVVRAVLGLAIAQSPLQGSLMRWVSLLVVVLIAAIWGYIDGSRDRRRNADPDNGADLTMLWLKAALLGGVVAGAVAWIVDQLPKFDLGDNSLVFELTSGAAWTVLLIFVPAVTGVALGRFLSNRKANKASASRHAPVAVAAGGGSAAAATDDVHEDTLRYEDTERYRNDDSSEPRATGSHARADDSEPGLSLDKRDDQSRTARRWNVNEPPADRH